MTWKNKSCPSAAMLYAVNIANNICIILQTILGFLVFSGVYQLKRVSDGVEYSQPDQNQFGAYLEYRGSVLRFIPD